MTIFADIDLNHPDKITLSHVPYMLKEITEALPGIKYDNKLKDGTWRLNLGWTNCLAIRSTYKDNLEIGTALNEWAANEISTRIQPCMALREAMDAPGLDSLYPFQRAGVQFLKTAKRGILADEMGTGKTRQAIVTLMEHYREGRDPFPALIIAPNSTKIGWQREFDEVWPGLTVTVVNGSITQRRKQLKTPSHVFIINWESVRSHSRLAPYGSYALIKCVECGGEDESITDTKCQVHEKELNKIDFKSVVADECHKMKDGKSQQTRAVKAATGRADIRIAMSGTPIANDLSELWSVLNWVSPEEWPGKTKFIDLMVEVSMDMYGKKSYIGLKSSKRDEFFAALHPRLRRMTKDVVLPFLPPVVRERRDVEMSPKQRKAYEQMRDTMIAELDDGDLLITTSPVQRAMRMLQFASSFAEVSTEEISDDEVDGVKIKTHAILKNPSNKIDTFMDDLDDFGDNQVVVFAASRQLIELLSEKMTAKNIRHGLITGAIDNDERQIHMDDFQAGKTQFILATTGAGGTGITLTAANTVVFLQRPWSMIESRQAEDRARRIGSEIHDSITIIDYVSTGTLDEAVIEALKKKEDMLEDILQDKEFFKRVLENNAAAL